jgi:4-diphosphocytidyl-2-C-methyl-D-erythritol kinase
LISFPNCKINLGLNIISKRADGFHNLETVFYPIQIKDVLEIVQQQNETAGIEFTVSGLKVDGENNNNLCVKAYLLLKADFPEMPSIKMQLHKTIPMGAGLGGGSADGAFTLKLLNQKFRLNLSNEQLIEYALQLGSDCPFFIINQPSFAEQRGEALQPIDLDLSEYEFLIINPGVHINTGWAFSNIEPKQPVKSIRQIISQPIQCWKQDLVNDFEEAVFPSFPEIKSIKENLYTEGALYAAMSGSGSTVFGIFKKGQNLSILQRQYSNYLTKVV